MSGKVYGRVFKITQKDAKAYTRVDRSLRANPIGVTAMASVNGRGALRRSARSVAAGKTKSQRIERAKEVYRNGVSMAGLLKNRRKSTTKAKAKKTSSKRTKVAGTNYFKTKGGRYQNAKGKFVKASSVKKSTAKKRTVGAKRKVRKNSSAATAGKRRALPSRAVKRNKSVGYSKSYAAGYERMERAKKRKAARVKSASAKKRGSTKRSIGKYKRASVVDARTGKKRVSYLYRTKRGSLKKIPTRAIVASGHKTAAAIKRGRAKAAARMKKEGSAFVANKGKTRRKRAGRRLAAYMAAKRSGKTVKQAKSAALKKVPLQRGDQFKGEAKAPVTTGAKRTRVRRNKKKTAGAMRRLKRNGKKRVVKNRKRKLSKSKAAVAARRRRRAAAGAVAPKKSRKIRRKSRRVASKRTKRTRRKLGASKSRRSRKGVAKRRKARKGRKAGARKSTRRKKSRRVKRNGVRRQYRKNAFMANLKAVLLTGLFVTTGFLVHRIATNLVSDKLLTTTLPDNKHFQNWKKPLVGAGIVAVAIPAVGYVAPKRAIEIGAGMVASLLQSIIISALRVPEAPNADLLAAVAGYSNSKAYQLQGTRRRRRGVRGLERHATSIMPQYTQVRGYEQAAAGFEQAAAGFGAGMGEYFSGTGEYYTATGEYFAPAGTQGVGGYEPAGQLAMQATAGTNTVIRDGIRPDGNLDRVLSIAEAAAGLGEFKETRVGQHSEWIPNGPLWAGERAVTGNQETSEVSAGILSRQGGNGILSGG